MNQGRLEKILRACVLGWAFQAVPFFFFWLFAGIASGEAREPQPEYGRIFQIRVCTRTGCNTGFVKPWIGHIWNPLWRFEVALFCAVLVTVFALAIIQRVRRIKISN
jgi:hypothetical protein